ncbi:unnamed protein product [Cyclocybe aegerita]|uniref:Reverse transcriptase domain-containing protein n=1 Tax=Cyclocybe aegerita TaxID=1973307 RepID=A0A8S0WH72_CYCAE|nr:unnamed protein product [Cyclocybe aegerita]
MNPPITQPGGQMSHRYVDLAGLRRGVHAIIRFGGWINIKISMPKQTLLTSTQSFATSSLQPRFNFRKMSSNAATSSFGQTLQFITEIKLEELEKQRLAYQTHAKVLDEVKTLGDQDLLKKVEILSKTIKSWTGSGGVKDSKIVGGRIQLSTLEFWLQQAKKDPSFSSEIAQGWVNTLEDHIRHNLMRFDSAKLFGRLFNEWLASGDSSAVAYQPGGEDGEVDGSSQSSFDVADVGRKEMHEQKEKLVSIIFEDHPVDVEELKRYLEGLFKGEEAARSLEKLRKELKDFGYWFKRKEITKVDVTNAIKGLHASGLMDEEKRTTLKAFEENPTVLDEVTSVLNMRMANIKTWAWPKEGILVEFRRHLNGKYRAFTDPEIIDALLLHHIGVAWQVKIKTALRRIFDSKTWVRPDPATHLVKERRTEQLRGDDGSNSIQAERDNTRRANFFLSQLHDEAARPSAYDDLVDAPETEEATSPAAIKRKLLHIMTTECYLNTALHGTHTTLRSDLEWFGPSLPITSILTVLEFMGMSKTWLAFYKSFLAAPLRFPGETVPRVRKRGTPISYSLSVVCGEAILFMMDFAVNQRGHGLYLYRMHDDLWLWDAQARTVADAWAEMNRYAGLVGLKFNEKKTGSATIGGTSEDAARLPSGDVRWGFLQFDVGRSRFVIDQKDVDQHIVEMRRQLASTKSVFGWVNAYNKYMTFFYRNFGGLPANCFTKDHVIDMIDTMGRIQRELFPDDGSGGAVGHLRKTVAERFGTTDLPEGYFYFPISSGGLELRNTLLELFALERRDKPLTLVDDGVEEARINQDEEEEEEKSGSMITSESDDEDESEPDEDWSDDDDDEYFAEEKTLADKKFPRRIATDRRVYNSMQDVWDIDADSRRTQTNHPITAESDAFMSFEEFTALRESWLLSWGDSYRNMLQSAEVRDVDLVPKVRELTEQGVGSRRWALMDSYEKWVVSMYGEEVVNKYGSLEVVDPKLIPIGMVQLFKTSRMKLDQ